MKVYVLKHEKKCDGGLETLMFNLNYDKNCDTIVIFA